METAAENLETVGIIKSEQELVEVVDDLLMTKFNRDDITIQGAPKQLEDSLGKKYVNPELLQDSRKAPRQTFVMPEDFGYLIAFSISIPMFIGMVLAAILIDPIHNKSDFIIASAVILGGLLGMQLGFAIAHHIKKARLQEYSNQEKAGGFVIWIKTQTTDKIKLAKKILLAHHADNIHCLMPSKGKLLKFKH